MNNEIIEKNEGMEKAPVLTKKDCVKGAIRWSLMAVTTFNYDTQLAPAVVFGIGPLLRKIYKDDDEYVEALNNHYKYFNTMPWLANIVLGATLALEDKEGITSLDAVQNIKVSLMGPLAGMGDTIWQGVVIPILLAVCIDLTRSGSGNVWGAVIYAVVIVVAAYALSYWNFMFGYKAGSEAIMDFLEKGILNKLIKGASIMGCMVMGGLIVNYVKAVCGLKIVSSTTTYSIQTNFLDQVCPSILPLAVTLLVYYLMNKKRWSSLKIIGLIVVIGIVGGVTGILAY